MEETAGMAGTALRFEPNKEPNALFLLERRVWQYRWINFVNMKLN
jgi:hypothetical protein